VVPVCRLVRRGKAVGRAGASWTLRRAAIRVSPVPTNTRPSGKRSVTTDWLSAAPPMTGSPSAASLHAPQVLIGQRALNVAPQSSQV
jgi:hypothetical protein